MANIVINPSRIGTAEEAFCHEMAISGETMSAYKVAGYPLVNDKGKPLTDTEILRRSRTVAQLPLIKERTAELRKQYTKGAVTEWTRDEIVDGYRAIYNAASKHIIDEKRDDAGEVVQSKFNDRAATIAISVLEKITRIYGYDAPEKIDAKVEFIIGTRQAEIEDKPAYEVEGEVIENKSDTSVSPYAV